MLRSTRFITIGMCILLLCMTLFISVGYANVSDSLQIAGMVEVKEPQAVYITYINVASYSNTTARPTATKLGTVFYKFDNCTLRSQQNNSAGGSVTVEVTVRNGSGVAQYFVGHSMSPALPQGCVVSYMNISLGTVIQPDEEKNFRVTIQNTNRSTQVQLNSENVLNFSPDFDESFTEDASKGVAAVFGNVLAGKGIDGQGGGVYYEGRYYAADRIMQLLLDNMESVDTGGYIGNVGNASQEQKDLIEAIFGEHISMQLGNQYYSVSLLIKNQQIDGRGENDMVLYVTADQLAVGSGNWQNNAWRNLNNVPVYGLVFINNGRNNYAYCDHLFAGEAPVCNFGGAFGAGNVGNFNTNLWNSTEYPSVTDSSSGQITQDYITKDGELDDAYQYYIRNN